MKRETSEAVMQPFADGYADRLLALDQVLSQLEGGLAIAFSGGVDSAVLLHAAKRVLGAGALGVIADSPSLPRLELERARDCAAQIGAQLRVIGTYEGDDPRYQRNDALRCYWCKNALFEAMQAVLQSDGLAHLAYGENLDDGGDDRPGRRAAGEHLVRAPLAEAGFTKDDVRRYARDAGLKVAKKAASACLASRIPRGVVVTPQRLAKVEQAEACLHRLGFQVIRVRHQGAHAKLEFGSAEFGRATEMQSTIASELAQVGYATVEHGLYRSPEERAQQP
ncbi:MAG: hypothetical protein ACI835_004398 [Planctomycetota bacterium]